MKERFVCFDHKTVLAAASKYMVGKWNRNDTLSFVEKYVGIPRHEIILSDRSEYKGVKVEALEGMALYIEGECISLFNDGAEPELDEVKIRKWPDGMNGKIRDVALLCVEHQLLEHVAAEMLMPFFHAKFLPQQHASIPGHGQSGLRRQLFKYLQRDKTVKCYCKTDVVQAYRSLQYDVITDLIEEELPKAKDLIKLLRFLGRMAPDGHLIIGGYLDVWLFNLAMSYALRYALKQGKYRRDIFIAFAEDLESYMDDVAFLCTSISGAEKIIKLVDAYLQKTFDLKIKIVKLPVKLYSVKEEKRRRKTKRKSDRGCPGIDMAGFVIHRTYITIRPCVFRRARRQFLRAWSEYIKTGTLRFVRACKIQSYKGYFLDKRNKPVINSLYAIRKYHIKELANIASGAVSRHDRLLARKRKEKLNDYYKRIVNYTACAGSERGSSGFPAAYPYVKGCRGDRNGRRNRIQIQPCGIHLA